MLTPDEEHAVLTASDWYLHPKYWVSPEGML